MFLFLIHKRSYHTCRQNRTAHPFSKAPGNNSWRKLPSLLLCYLSQPAILSLIYLSLFWITDIHFSIDPYYKYNIKLTYGKCYCNILSDIFCNFEIFMYCRKFLIESAPSGYLKSTFSPKKALPQGQSLFLMFFIW